MAESEKQSERLVGIQLDDETFDHVLKMTNAMRAPGEPEIVPGPLPQYVIDAMNGNDPDV